MSFPLMPLIPPTGVLGVDWVAVGSISPADDLAQVSVSPSGVWVVTTDNITGRLYRSTDYGTTWSTRTLPNPDSTRGSAYGNGLFVVSEDGGDRVHSSADGLTWTSRYTGTNSNYNARFNDGYFVIGSSPGVGGATLASANGTTWASQSQTTAFGAEGRCGIYVASLGRTFLAGVSSTAKYVNTIPTASAAWTGDSTGVPATSFDVAWSPTASVAVLVGSAGIYSSTDLITWTQRFAASNFYGVAWCDTQFVAVGSAGKISTSPDGVTWTSRTSGTSSALYGVAFQGGVILVTGFDGTVLRSS